MTSLRARHRGFTFLEMALALFVMGFILAAVPKLLSLNTATAVNAAGATPEDAAKLALTGFVLKNSRLPCPATSPSTGVENCTLVKGFVPHTTLGLAKPVTNGDGLPFAYAIWGDSANTNHLGQLSAKYTPRYFNSSDSYWLDPIPTLTSAQQNGLDFCAKLRHAATLAAQPALTGVKNLRDAGQTVNMAWVLVDPGAGNANAAGATYPEFDGGNHPTAAGLLFESPSLAQSLSYDDKVSAASFTQLFGELQCPELLANVSAAAREANFANENWRVRKYLYDFRVYEQKIREQKLVQAQNFLLIAGFDVAFAVVISTWDLAVALASASGAASIAVIAITAVATIALAAYNLAEAIKGVADATAEVAEGVIRVADALAAVTAAATFRTERQNALLLLDQRSWFQ